MVSPTDLQKYYKFCADIDDTQRRGYCEGYIDQCVSHLDDIKSKDDSTYALIADMGATLQGLDFDRCLSLTPIFSLKGSPKRMGLATKGASVEGPRISESRPSMGRVRSFAYVLSRLDEALVTALERTPYDLVVVTPPSTVKNADGSDTKGIVSRLKGTTGASGQRKMVLGYLSIGMAARHFAYWDDGWRIGNPSFLLGRDPAGWNGSAIVDYTDGRWQDILSKQVQEIASAGFDGIVLDWVGAYQDSRVVGRLRSRKKDPAAEMAKLVKHITSVARKINPDFKVIGINPGEISENASKLFSAVIVEPLHYQGRPDARWGDPRCCDIPLPSADTEQKIMIYQDLYRDKGVPVFFIDYAKRHAPSVYEEAKRLGFIGLATEPSLSDLTTTPPPF